MSIEKAWKDPETGQTFKYDWGFDVSTKKEERLLLTTACEHIDRYKEERIMALYKEKEKEFMERISYVCGKCRENVPCNPYCMDCQRGSKFRELPPGTLAKMVDKRVNEMIKEACTMRKSPVPAIKDVKFNPPATIIFWADKTKTVVKAQGNDAFDPEKGLAMAIIKKLCGNKGNYNNVFHKWLAKYEVPEADQVVENEPEPETTPKEDLPWKIWFKRFDEKGKQISAGVTHYEYKRKSNATRRAKALYADKSDYKWIVSQTNPWGEEAKNAI